ncbi:NAD-dependent epimerase [Microbacterium faecale]|uniref:NAD-dependent epimerase n=1 Tax=Microbacterium faecale TaxID=1804630 RepID=A0A917DG88_9MICO|nr:DUF1731 domain-containing protein [Microbacterium faecale]GGD37581.1 NAD-dependent epimerase [Microbacterium faecale]
MKVVIAGGTGALGRALAMDLLHAGHEVVVLTRRPGHHRITGTTEVGWDPRDVGAWAHALETDGELAVVNLAGKLVDCRPTEENIRALRESRVIATEALVEAAGRLTRPVDRWLQASTTAIYGDSGEQHITEETPDPISGLPQMTGVVLPWEAAARGANATHRVTIRTSIVLDRGTPALNRLLLPAKLGFGGPIASGRQWFSWIHIDDWLRVARAALGLDSDVTLPDAPVIAATPNPVRNEELMRRLREAIGVPFGLPTPEFVLRLASIGLRTDPLLALTGRHTTSSVLAERGFAFRYPTLESALADLLR